MNEQEQFWGFVRAELKDLKQVVSEVRAQTILTNGRVKALELFKMCSICIFGTAVLTVAFMLCAYTQGWITAIIEFGGK